MGLGYVNTYGLAITGLNEGIVGVLAWFQDDAGEVFELVLGVGGIHCASHVVS